MRWDVAKGGGWKSGLQKKGESSRAKFIGTIVIKNKGVKEWNRCKTWFIFFRKRSARRARGKKSSDFQEHSSFEPSKTIVSFLNKWLQQPAYIFWLTFSFNHVIWNVCMWLLSYLVTWSAKFDAITWGVRVGKTVLLIKSTYQTWCLLCKIGKVERKNSVEATYMFRQREGEVTYWLKKIIEIKLFE